MDKDALLHTLLEQPYYIIDFLPERIPADANGRFSEVEEYFLRKEKRTEHAEKIKHIILKLLCYYKAEVYCHTWLDSMEIHELASLIEQVIVDRNGDMHLLLVEEEVLIQIEHGVCHITVYHPNECIQRLMASLAVSEGLFWWKG